MNIKIFLGAILCFAISTLQALVMDFGSGSGAAVALSSSFNQNGLTMTPIDTVSTANSFTHWDLFKGNSAYSTVNDWSAAIHMGNKGELVEFSFGGAAFDLLSFEIEHIVIDDEFPNYTLFGTFTASNGASISISNTGVIDFSLLSGFQNITSFQFSMPLGVAGTCSDSGQNCSSMLFDNIVFREALPLPTTLWLFYFGLLNLTRFVYFKK